MGRAYRPPCLGGKSVLLYAALFLFCHVCNCAADDRGAALPPPPVHIEHTTLRVGAIRAIPFLMLSSTGIGHRGFFPRFMSGLVQHLDSISAVHYNLSWVYCESEQETLAHLANGSIDVAYLPVTADFLPLVEYSLPFYIGQVGMMTVQTGASGEAGHEDQWRVLRPFSLWTWLSFFALIAVLGVATYVTELCSPLGSYAHARAMEKMHAHPPLPVSVVPVDVDERAERLRKISGVGLSAQSKPGWLQDSSSADNGGADGPGRRYAAELLLGSALDGGAQGEGISGSGSRWGTNELRDRRPDDALLSSPSAAAATAASHREPLLPPVSRSRSAGAGLGLHSSAMARSFSRMASATLQPLQELGEEEDGALLQAGDFGERAGDDANGGNIRNERSSGMFDPFPQSQPPPQKLSIVRQRSAYRNAMLQREVWGASSVGSRPSSGAVLERQQQQQQRLRRRASSTPLRHALSVNASSVGDVASIDIVDEYVPLGEGGASESGLRRALPSMAESSVGIGDGGGRDRRNSVGEASNITWIGLLPHTPVQNEIAYNEAKHEAPKGIIDTLFTVAVQSLEFEFHHAAQRATSVRLLSIGARLLALFSLAAYESELNAIELQSQFVANPMDLAVVQRQQLPWGTLLDPHYFEFFAINYNHGIRSMLGRATFYESIEDLSLALKNGTIAAAFALHDMLRYAAAGDSDVCELFVHKPTVIATVPYGLAFPLGNATFAYLREYIDAYVVSSSYLSSAQAAMTGVLDHAGDCLTLAREAAAHSAGAESMTLELGSLQGALLITGGILGFAWLLHLVPVVFFCLGCRRCGQGASYWIAT